jgi:hypothetical protein
MRYKCMGLIFLFFVTEVEMIATKLDLRLRSDQMAPLRGAAEVGSQESNSGSNPNRDPNRDPNQELFGLRS